MAFMNRKDRRVSDINKGDLLLVADPPSGPWFIGIRGVEDFMGMRTFHLFGGKTITLALHQTWVVGK